MPKIFIVAVLLMVTITGAAQNKTPILTDGAGLLFKNTKSKLSIEEKNWLFEQLHLTVSDDKKKFIEDDQEVFVGTYVTDLDADGKEEVFISTQMDLFFATAPETYIMFTKNTAGKFEKQREIENGIVLVLETKTMGWPDIALERVGFNYTVYQWNGKEYKYAKAIKEADFKNGQVKYATAEKVSKAYGETLK